MKKLTLFIFILLLSTSLLMSGLVFAEDSGTDTATDAADYACASTMIESGSELLEAYQTFLNEYFQVDTPSSSQLEDAMMFYRYVEDSLQNLYAANSNIDSNQSLDIANQELSFCRFVRDQYSEYAKVLLKRQMNGSAVSKTTFKVVDGLKVMNEDLADLSETFQATFPNVFNKMNAGLVCYPHDCVTQ